VSGRLPTHVEVASILRRTSAAGDFATVMRRGDPDRGTLLLVVTNRGRHIACLERVLTLNGDYHWHTTGPGDSVAPGDVADFIDRRARFDEDLWAIELDIADAERFIAETTVSG
jgi:hypothetical protein